MRAAGEEGAPNSTARITVSRSVARLASAPKMVFNS
jgi:hypothetical protein